MKRIFCICICLWALNLSGALAQTASPPVVVVQTYYSGVTRLNTFHILVSRGEGKTDHTEVKITEKQTPAEAEALQQVIAKLYQDGYTLQGSFGTRLSSLVFVKRP